MNAVNTKVGAARSSLVLSAASILSGLLNAAALVLTARQGHIDEIASYTVVTAVLVMGSIAMTGASATLYVAGTGEQRRAIRSQRVLVVVPALIVGVGLIGAVYTERGYAWVPILMSGLVVIGNNVSELQYGDLSRQARFSVGAMINCGSKIPAVVLIAAGVPLTVGLAVAAAVQFVAAEAVLGRSSWWRGIRAARPTLLEARSAFRMNRHLHMYGIAELYSGRVSSAGLSLLATPQVMASFGTVVSIFQAFGTVLYAGLQVPMTARVRARLGLGSVSTFSRHIEVVAVIGAIGAAIFVISVAPWLTDEFLQLPLPEAATWLRVLAMALPFLILNRVIMLAFIGDGDFRMATRLAILIMLFLTLGLVLALPRYGPLGAAGATLFAEAVTVGVLVFVRILQRSSLSKSRSARHSSI